MTITPLSRGVADIDERGAGLDDLLARIAGRFGRVEPRQLARAYVRGLLSSADGMYSNALASDVGHPVPHGMYKLLNSARWDADAVRDDVRGYVIEHLAADDATLLVYETGFAKRGTRSVGVQRQYNQATGRLENCQLGVFLIYVSSRGVALIDRDLYLPPSWEADSSRRRAVGVPQTVTAATRIEQAQRMIERAVTAGVPFSWVSAYGDYARDIQFRRWLQSRRIPYILAVPRPEPTNLHHRRPTLLDRRTLAMTRTAGIGSSHHEWFALAHSRQEPGWMHWLFALRNADGPQTATYHLSFFPENTTAAAPLRIAATREAIRAAVADTIEQVGLTRYEVRTYHAWYRHMTLAMAAYAFLAMTANSRQASTN